MRDWVHANDNGKMILGRILEAWFAPAPTLRIDRDGDSLLLSWPLAATGYHLETTTALTMNTAWISNATPFVITNGRNLVTTNRPPDVQLFYRLRRP